MKNRFTLTPSLRGRSPKQSPTRRGDCFVVATLLLAMTLLASCAPVDLNAPIPAFDTGVDSTSWAQVPEGEFFYGQFNKVEFTPTFEIMVTDVTAQQYADFLNAAVADGTLKVDGDSVLGYYPGDEFRGVKHELEIKAGDWQYIPLADPSQRVRNDGTRFTVQEGYENHPMTMVTWFGAWGYCQYYDASLPSEIQWEKAARGTDGRPFPWGWEIQRENANFYSSRDPFEDMSSFGSRTSPVGFYNGKTYDGYVTLDSKSPYGLYDMAGNVWQWVGDVMEGFSDRFMHGGSKDTYDMDLRVWVRNSAPPMYFSPGVGFRCVR
ncbi:MAG: SUMF1/EgtB/PvdO family nonheme iron enzyme [Chloroflexi bacterium]|nr:SUMF1/EgtB/PvdO family nonheme iron enzyme [Chloroflexota bacterium]